MICYIASAAPRNFYFRKQFVRFFQYSNTIIRLSQGQVYGGEEACGASTDNYDVFFDGLKLVNASGNYCFYLDILFAVCFTIFRNGEFGEKLGN